MTAKRILIIAVMIILAGGLDVDISAYESLSDPVSITSQGTIPLTPGSLVDDFDIGVGKNIWGERTALYKSSNAAITASYASDLSIVFGTNGRSLQLDYDVNPSGAWASYSSPLGGVDFTTTTGYGFRYLSFWVKGSANGILFKIQLTSHNGTINTNHAAVCVTDYLIGGVTTSWQKVNIPLDAFLNIADWTSIKDMSIVFENSQSGWNGSPLSGTVYIDNISFGKQFLGYLRLHNFDKKGPSPNTACITNATGGQSNISSGGGASGSAIADNAYRVSNPYSLKYDFSGMSSGNDAYFAYYMILGGGDNGWVESPHNLSAYSQISFYIKGATGNEYGIKAELSCSERSTYIFLKGIISDSWTKQTIWLSSFKDKDSNGAPTGDSVNTATLIKCSFTYNYWLYNWNHPNHPSSGTIYIDDLQLETLNYVPDSTAPTAPITAPVVSGSGVVTLSTTASSAANDSTMEHVRFDYSLDQINWKAAGYDYDTLDSSYSSKWDTSGLAAGTYHLRAVAMDAAGNSTASAISTYTKS